MKKLIFLLAVSAIVAACNKPAQKEAVQEEEVVIEEVVPADSLTIDSTETVDSTIVTPI